MKKLLGMAILGLLASVSIQNAFADGMHHAKGACAPVFEACKKDHKCVHEAISSGTPPAGSNLTAAQLMACGAEMKAAHHHGDKTTAPATTPAAGGANGT